MRGFSYRTIFTALIVLSWLGCSGGEESDSTGSSTDPARVWRLGSGPVLEADDEILERRPEPNPDRFAYFGDLHVHTTYSFDAYAFGTLATPYDAYRYARGEAILHPAGFEVQLRQPLDFYAVTDHAMFLGVAAAAGDTSTEFSKTEVAKPLNDLNAPDNRGITSVLPRVQVFGSFLPNLVTGIREGSIDREEVLDITRSAWQDTITAADLFNDPGRFTTFVAYEYTTSSDDRGNLHRNVIFKGSDKLPAVPFSRFHSQNPEGLWEWMDGLREQGIESLAIPHNSNGSNGQMFKMVNWAGDPLDDEYTTRRIRNEPLVEITQVKGTSETHPVLSSRDEWADFEIMPYRVATMLPSEPAGSYARDALRRGLSLEGQGITNPYAFGFIGSSDTHTGATSDDEANYFSKLGVLDATPELRSSTPLSLLPALLVRYLAPQMIKEVDGETYLETATPTYGASGLAAVWAEENTRDAIYQAFRRKETFATSGPRIRLRFFAGYDFEDEMLDEPGAITRAYETGVTMGSDLPARSGAEPRFVVWALADAQGAPLQRLQIIKGWTDAQGETHEEVYDVACSEGAAIDPATHRCPDNGARVNLADCTIPSDIGAKQLRSVWRDPNFDESQRAFYYARVLENPTCRWSTWDAIREGVPPRSDFPKTIQERAWSSPIWIDPTGEGAATS
ncbi:MAG: DUF3604 domain-containing protein [Myxococcota bacterium]